MANPSITLKTLTAANAAMERVLADDRAGRVVLPRDTYMDLLRASGSLSVAVESITSAHQIPVEGVAS